MTTWRDDLSFRAAERVAREWIELPERPEPSVAVFAASKAAVEAYKRWLTSEIENLPSPDEDGIYVWTLDVLTLLEETR